MHIINGQKIMVPHVTCAARNIDFVGTYLYKLHWILYVAVDIIIVGIITIAFLSDKLVETESKDFSIASWLYHNAVLLL